MCACIYPDRFSFCPILSLFTVTLLFLLFSRCFTSSFQNCHPWSCLDPSEPLFSVLTPRSPRLGVVWVFPACPGFLFGSRQCQGSCVLCAREIGGSSLWTSAFSLSFGWCCSWSVCVENVLRAYGLGGNQQTQRGAVSKGAHVSRPLYFLLWTDRTGCQPPPPWPRCQAFGLLSRWCVRHWESGKCSLG